MKLGKRAAFGFLFAASILPVLPSIDNSLRSHNLARQLASANLPSGARVIKSFGRVYNGGNGGGCDYQGLAIISYYGEVSALRDAFLRALQDYAERFPDAKIMTGDALDDDIWGAKIRGGFTEVSIRPNTDHSSLYLVALTYAPRHARFDPRCM
ncbi:MAG: hypothetical protein AB7U46_15630 [Paenirhodobacter sp.]|uniref:hypothetical protein n=1 Tax=Paenirhodobacter sp. TaxID=1965326 RepID=UPI003D116583